MIPEKRQMMCPSVALTADRFVMKSDSTISTKSTIKIHARTMTFNKCVLTSDSTFLREKDHSACEGIQVMNTELIVQHKLAGSNMSLRAKFVSFPDFYVKLFGGRINISAEQLHLGASMGGTPDLVAMAQYEATLGWLGGTWTLGSLVAAAETLSFAMDHRVEVLGTSCDNQELPRRHDYCQELLHSWPWSEKTLGDALSWVPGVKFTSVIFASRQMHMKPRTRFLSASALFCAGEELNLENASSILSQGKGCPAGQGDGAGEVRTHFAVCGGGGASNMGAGGDGALRVEGEKALWHCTAKGFVTEWDGTSLPLTGASGGGCSSGLRPQLRSSSLAFSAGGGLLWLSTPKLYLNASSRVKADGLQGTIVGKSAKLAMATGGGAGGQILIFTEDIRVEECMEDEGCEPPELSAEGGDAHCSSAQNTVGGAGGGGFIGLWWLGGAPTAHEDLGQLVKLQVAGGTLTKTCADVLSQDLHSDVFGRQGMAVSLAPCPEGHAGPFCASCAIGQWGSGHGHGHCHHCDNKPKTPNAVYAKMAWPNSSCPFHCVPGVPEVKMNPNCLSNFDFAMGFFGGKLGFKITLALPITIFFIIRLVHRLRRKRRTRPSCGRWQFPREELPCHVARIYLLGNNSAGSPWTLPERGPLHDDATVQEMLGEDEWQALGETLQNPLKIAPWESWWLLHLSPWLELLLLRRRLGRAKRAQRAVLLAAESLKDMEGKPSMKFGCDESATTGYLDIFDFGRSALDWAPRNLKEEEQLLLAQGAGTWARPYELNIADPLLLGVAQSQGSQGPIGTQMIYSLVCAFNLFSRLVPSAELLDVLWGDEAPAFAVLQREVELSARRLSLQAAAQVQILRMSRGHKGEPVAAGGATKPSPARPESFTDLVQQLPLEGAPAVVANNVEELKLCLVLRAKKDRRLLRQSSEESGLKKPQGFFYTLRRSLLRFRAQRLLRWVRVPNAAKLGTSNLVVSLFFFMLILFEGMASVILWSTFSRLEIEQAIGLWMLFPSPMAPLSPLMGLAALLLRRPLFCRLQAHLSLMASINLAVVGFTYGQEGLLKPCLVLFLLHVVVCYFAAIYSGLEMSSADVQLAEDSGGDASLQSLRESSAPAPRSSLRPLPREPHAENEGICMALWRSPARPHADSVESDVGGAAAEASRF